jgi:hypothetical protein
MVINSRNTVRKPYGVMFDEAKLQEIFSRIGQLETQAASETGDINKDLARKALMAKFENQKKEVIAYRDTSLAKIKALKTSLLEPEASAFKTTYVNMATGNAYSVKRYSNAAIETGYAEIIAFLKKMNFSEATIASATSAINVVKKYSIWNYTSPETVGDAVIVPDKTPNTSQVARGIGIALADIISGLTDEELYSTIYSNLPNPFDSDYAAKFATYFAANYRPD